MKFPRGQAPQCKSVDISIEFNSEANFFFERPNNGTIQSDQFDFLTVAIHEYIML